MLNLTEIRQFCLKQVYDSTEAFQILMIYGCFRLTGDINDIVLQEGETIDAMWATDDGIRKMIKNKEFVEYNELPFIDELFNSYT